MKTDDFDYYLPNELIAQVPLEDRAESRMLVLDRDTGDKIDDKFYNIIKIIKRFTHSRKNNVRNSYFKVTLCGLNLSEHFRRCKTP